MSVGRKPVPDNIKELTGSHNKRNASSPRFRSADSVKPLKSVERDPIALEEWERVLPELVANGLLTRASLAIFGSYCLAFAAAEHAQLDVDITGRYIEEPRFNKAGDLVAHIRKPNPSIVQASHARLEMLRHAVEFGMTPSAATRVAANANGDEKPKDDFGSFLAPQDDEVEVKDSNFAN